MKPKGSRSAPFVCSAWLLVILCLIGCRGLEPALRGFVYDAETEAPIAGASLTSGDRAAQASADGSYKLRLPPGERELRVTAPGYAPRTLPLSMGGWASTTPLNVGLVRAVVFGLVLDARTHEPVPGADIRLGQRQIVADAKGQFAMRFQPDQPLVVSHPGYLDESLSPQRLGDWLATTSGSARKLEILLAPRRLEGTVTDADTGKPLPGVLVLAGELASDTDAEGRYALSHVQLGVRVSFVSSDHQRPQSTAYVGQERIDVALWPWKVSLTVTDAVTGSPLPLVTVSAPGMQVLTDEMGQVALRVRPQTSITLCRDGYRKRVLTYEGQETLSVVLAPAYLTGRLIDKEERSPVTRAVVQGRSADGELTLADVDASGTFTISAGLQSVTLKAPGYLRRTLSITAGSGITVEMTPFEVRGIYMPFGVLTRPDRIKELLDLISSSELNTVVVDVKSDRARLAWPSDLELAQQIGAYQRDVVDLEGFVEDCHERGIYTIARMVVFKDDLLATQRMDLAVKHSDGEMYKDLEDLHWVDPFRQEVRDYNIALAREVAELGFDEVQFDYLRFPSGGNTKDLRYSEEATFEARTAAMATFCAQAHEALRPTRAFLSADVFGLTVWVDPSRDMGIGQRVDDIAPYVDYLSPMLYPSTFGEGNLGFDRPALYPYQVVYHSVLKAGQRTSTLVRPWLQHYSLGGVDYDNLALLKQRRAAEDADSCGWLYWNGRGRYEADVFEPDVYERYGDALQESIDQEKEEE